MISLVKRHPIITFFVLTYAIGWGLIPFWTFQAGSPFIAALIVIPLTRGFGTQGARLADDPLAR